MTLRLFLIRHGETAWSLSGQHSGHADIPLTENGEEEARQLGERIRKFSFKHVLTSPLLRARRTSELAGLSRNAKDDPDLIEWDNGDRVWGEQIEDRGSQVTFSGLGQKGPIEEKDKWDPNFTKRKRIRAILSELIPEYAVNLGGTTSIDVTMSGIDKAYGIRKLRDLLGIAIADMSFIGDAIFPGGNDYRAKQAGALSICVRDPEESKRFIEAIIACLSDGKTANNKDVFHA